MAPTESQVRQHIEASLVEMTEFARKEFGFSDDWNVVLKTSFSSNRVRSWGGVRDLRPFISISASRFLNPVTGMCEYTRYCHNKTIGSIKTTDWKIYADALLAHELAHAVQMSLILLPNKKPKSNHSTYIGLGQTESGHGKFFQNIYAVLRRKFINHRLCENQIGTYRTEKNYSTIRSTPESYKAMKYIGKQIVVPGLGDCRIVDYKIRNHKYPLVVQHPNGQLYKISANILKEAA